MSKIASRAFYDHLFTFKYFRFDQSKFETGG